MASLLGLQVGQSLSVSRSAAGHPVRWNCGSEVCRSRTPECEFMETLCGGRFG